jgi:hypothetical protein
VFPVMPFYLILAASAGSALARRLARSPVEGA